MQFDVLTFGEFCERNRICRSHLYHLISRGEGPRFMRLGARVLITREAEADWRREREAAAIASAPEAA